MEGGVLIIENETKLADSIRESFKHNFGIWDFKNREEAMLLLNDERCRFDVALVDLDDPGTGGTEMIEYVKRTRPNARIVVLAGPGLKEEVLKVRPDALLWKPQSPDTVFHTIKDLCRAKDYLEVKSLRPDDFEHFPKGTVYADILLHDDLKPDTFFLADNLDRSRLARLRVQPANNIEEAYLVQLLRYTEIVLVNLATISYPPKFLFDRLSRCEFPPKGYIFFGNVFDNPHPFWGDSRKKVEGYAYSGNPWVAKKIAENPEVLMGNLYEEEIIDQTKGIHFREKLSYPTGFRELESLIARYAKNLNLVKE